MNMLDSCKCITQFNEVKTSNNPSDWLVRFQQAYESSDIDTLHSLRMEIYRETINIAQEGSYQVGATSVALPEPGQMMADSVLYVNPGKVDVSRQAQATLVDVVESDSLLAGKKLLEEGYNHAVLNFANRQIPGG